MQSIYAFLLDGQNVGTMFRARHLFAQKLSVKRRVASFLCCESTVIFNKPWFQTKGPNGVARLVHGCVACTGGLAQETSVPFWLVSCSITLVASCSALECADGTNESFFGWQCQENVTLVSTLFDVT